MNDPYQKTIQFLQVYRGIPRAQNLLAKATNKLLEKQEEFHNIAEIVRNVQNIIDNIKNSDRSKQTQMKIIVEAFFAGIKVKNQGFEYVTDGVYWFDSKSGPYTFEIKYIDQDTVTLKRHKKGNRLSKCSAYSFDEFPSLALNKEEEDKKLIKKILEKIHMELKRTWHYLHVDETPSQTTTEEDGIEFLENPL